jgi:hypothetical protein
MEFLLNLQFANFTLVAFLTDLVYTAIAFNVGSGDSPCVN